MNQDVAAFVNLASLHEAELTVHGTHPVKAAGREV